MTINRSGPLVCIIVVNYNGYDDTKECLESIQQIEYDNFKTIVVDNGSKDFSVDKLEPEFHDVIYIKRKDNLGYTGGNNLGIAKAIELKAEYIFILNNDTTVSKNILISLIKHMESNSDTGMISPLILYYDKPNIINFSGGTVNRNSSLKRFFYKDRPKNQLKERVIDCSFLEGSALFIRTCLLEKIGGFNEIYFLSAEETELCVKIADMGYKLSVITDCHVWHKVSRSMKKESMLWSYFLHRNKLYFVKNNSKSIKLRDVMSIIRWYMINFLSFLIKKKNIPATIGILLGVYGFIKRDTGKGIYENLI